MWVCVFAYVRLFFHQFLYHFNSFQFIIFFFAHVSYAKRFFFYTILTICEGIFDVVLLIRWNLAYVYTMWVECVSVCVRYTFTYMHKNDAMVFGYGMHFPILFFFFSKQTHTSKTWEDLLMPKSYQVLK